MKGIRISTCALVALVLGSTACTILDPRPDPTRFLVLASSRELRAADAEASAATDGARSKLAIGVGPVAMPDYLERAELMVRASATELAPSRIGHWAEPFGDMLRRVLAEDIAHALAPERIVLYPWYASDRPDAQVEVDVVRFEPDARGEVVLIARWRSSVLGAVERSVARESRFTHAAKRDDPAAIAAAMSEALAELAGEIAGALRGE